MGPSTVSRLVKVLVLEPPAGSPRRPGTAGGGRGLPAGRRGVRCGCVASCLFVLGGPAGAGVFGVVVITGMAQP